MKSSLTCRSQGLPRQQQKTFPDYLREADKNLFPTINNYSSYSDIEAYLQRFGKLDIRQSKDRDQLTFAVLILTGKAENFAQLEGRDWITASSIGASAPNQPYYKLDKE